LTAEGLVIIIFLKEEHMNSKISIGERKDNIILLLFCPGETGEANEPITSRSRLSRMLFLLKEETDFSGVAHDFEPGEFGPFSFDLHADLEFLLLSGFIMTGISEEEALAESLLETKRWKDEFELEDNVTVHEEERFCLTYRGLRFAKKLWDSPSLSCKDKKTLERFKRLMVGMPVRAMMRYINIEYPSYVA
jgi:uncharacterized protein YwgA